MDKEEEIERDHQRALAAERNLRQQEMFEELKTQTQNLVSEHGSAYHSAASTAIRESNLEFDADNQGTIDYITDHLASILAHEAKNN